ncbi:MAG TPA: TSUP family transporter [Candidatus Kapabacteria bacterium]|nr:TSUP family transporter [Candidatus Kapabacteria bacterium]
MSDLILLCLAAFAGGFIDAVVGGGGLIQTPAAIILLPHYPIATVIGTIKIPSFSGTSMAAMQYSKHVNLNYRLLLLMVAVAFISSIAGSAVLTTVSNGFMKPLILIVLIAVAIYTYSNKQFGLHSAKTHTLREQIWIGLLICLPLGFYDGFIGPGTGSFLILCFITILGFDFIHSSANAKFVNLATNLGSIIYFMASGHILYQFALPMAAANGIGGFLGARLAILRGNTFIRLFFLTVVLATIVRFAWEVFR